MSVKRVVDTSLWSNVRLVNEFSAEDKYFMLYILTNQYVRQCGIYKLPKRIISFEMGYTVEAIECILDRFQNAYKIIAYDHGTNEIAILSYLKHAIVKGGKPVYDCLEKDYSDVVNKDLIGIVYDFLEPHFRRSTKETDKIIEKIMLEQISKNDDTSTIRPRYAGNDNENDNENEEEETTAAAVEGLKEIVKVYEQEIGTITPIIAEEIELFLDDLPEDLITRAIQEASIHNVKSWKYISSILNRCLKEGIKTKADFENRRSRQKEKPRKKENGKYADVYRN